jgi:hypothetical protein
MTAENLIKSDSLPVPEKAECRARKNGRVSFYPFIA